jgi:hypothetical protein
MNGAYFKNVAAVMDEDARGPRPKGSKNRKISLWDGDQNHGPVIHRVVNWEVVEPTVCTGPTCELCEKTRRFNTLRKGLRT